LAGEKAQLHLVYALVAGRDPTAKEVDPGVEIEEAQTLDLFEVHHLETQKKPSNSTYWTQSEKQRKKNYAKSMKTWIACFLIYYQQ